MGKIVRNRHKLSEAKSRVAAGTQDKKTQDMRWIDTRQECCYSSFATFAATPAFEMLLQSSKYYNLDLKIDELQTLNHQHLVQNEG